MSSSDRDTNEASPNQRFCGTHSNFKAEWFKDLDLNVSCRRTLGMKY